ncbi:hypothetical protein A9K65_005205 [Mesorhizobium sp. WSM1497]|nr:hypothetical protein A9K65_005205 [Mesorhizobium sp. WSM1497]
MRQGTPLWPAGHLPLKRGDWQLRRRHSFYNFGDWRNRKNQPISPLEGEMPGRAEGGVQARSRREITVPSCNQETTSCSAHRTSRPPSTPQSPH